MKELEIYVENPVYDANYFIVKFEAIPEGQWHTGDYVNKDDPRCLCALGHCDARP